MTDTDNVEIEVDVFRMEGEELALATAREVEREECKVDERLVLDGWEKRLNSAGVQQSISFSGRLEPTFPAANMGFWGRR